MSNPSRFDDLIEFIGEQDWHWVEGKTIPYGRQIVVSNTTDQVPINYYFKHQKIVVGGSDCSLKQYLLDWLEKPGKAIIAPSQPTISPSHMGLDESGKGDWFGPIVIAAVYVNETTAHQLRQHGIKDSKKLNSAQISEATETICQIVPQHQRLVRVVLPEEYNQLYEQYQNLNILLASIYADVAHEVWRQTNADQIVCDKFSQKTERLDDAFSSKRVLPLPIQEHHAEDLSIAVAAASILATAAFTASLEELGRRIGLNTSLPKGASDIRLLSSTLDEVISRVGMNSLHMYGKLNFKPIQQVINPQKSSQPTPQPQSIVQNTEAKTVVIQQELWQLQYHPAGFWRFRFADGGILDWYESSTGKLDVRGKETAQSYIILREKAHGKVWTKNIEAIEERLRHYLSELEQKEVSPVAGIGWLIQDTLLGSRVDFSDGTVLQHYRTTGKLLLQGRPTESVKQALSQVINFRFQNPTDLIELLKKIFPDWKLGENMQMNRPSLDWQPLDDAFNWSRFWNSTQALRRAAGNSSAPCQKEFLEDWASVLYRHNGKRHLLAHAPTGLGKTVSSLVPVLAWLAQLPDRRKVFYVVNRITQHENPVNELKSGLASTFEELTGHQLKVVDLVGRSHLCVDPNGLTLSDICRESRDNSSFDNLPSTSLSWQEVQNHLSGDFCPYHFLQGLMAEAHLIICDYWWVFTEIGRQALSRRNILLDRNCVVIVDEAHNLPLRIRGDWTIDLGLAELVGLVNQSPLEIQDCLRPLITFCQQVIGINEAAIELPFDQVLHQIGGHENIQTAIQVLIDLEDELDGVSESPLLRLLRLLELQQESIVIYLSTDLQGIVHLVCKLIDPSPLLNEVYSQVAGSLTMSGTLAAPTDNSEELQYQVPLFGLSLQETLARKYASPFSLKHQRWIYNTDTYGTYEERGKYSADYARHIVAVGKATPGVTAIFLNSYEFLNDVYGTIQQRFPDEATLILRETTGQESIDEIAEYEYRLNTLVEQYGRAYLFAIYQGKLSEGANFKNNLLKSIVCVSIPMEYPSPYHERLAARYEELFQPVNEIIGGNSKRKAREYALDRYALSLVLQSCGRGIRSDQDRCTFILLDKRYDEYTDRRGKKGGYDWRRFLMPRPYNLSRPEIDVKDFHSTSQTSPSYNWDNLLMAACGKGEM